MNIFENAYIIWVCKTLSKCNIFFDKNLIAEFYNDVKCTGGIGVFGLVGIKAGTFSLLSKGSKKKNGTNVMVMVM